MASYRIEQHPILPVEPRASVAFTWQGRELMALEGETIASALFANGIRIFGHHPKDNSPQGIFCANGQCAQCLVLADGMPVKSCMELVRPGVRVEPADGLPELPKVGSVPAMHEIDEIEVPVLIIGGGPAGMSAAVQLGQRGIRTLLVDDKHRLGGKLVLQTHRFFGSVNAVYAGTRGIDIATRLEREVQAFDCVDVWLDSTALAVFSDRKVGILRGPQPNVMLSGSSTQSAARQIASEASPPADAETLRPLASAQVRYVLVTPQVILAAAARGRSRWPSVATPCPVSTAPAPSRRWSTATWCGQPSACSSSAAATWG